MDAAEEGLRAVRCPLCHEALGPDEPTSSCAACGTAHHRACVTELEVACATLGCPAAAPPAVVASEPASPLWPLVFTWVLFTVLWPTALVTLGWAMLRARRHLRLRPAVTVLASPFVALPLCTVVDAVQGYVRGTASVIVSRERWKTSSGLEPLVRCPEERARHDAVGPHLLTRGTNELVLRDLARLFGPMPGGYDGPLPTSAEARDALARARPGTRTADGRWAFDAQGRRVEVELGVALAREVLGYHPGEPTPIQLAWLDARSLLIASAHDPGRALLCDLRSRRPVAAVRLP